LSLVVSAFGCEAPMVEEASTEHAVLSQPGYELFQDEAGEWRFNLVAKNHEVILSSEGYATRTGALNGILSVIANVMEEGGVEILTADDGQFYFVVIAANSEVVGTSELYTTKAKAKKGISAVVKASLAISKVLAKSTGAGFELFQGQDDQFYFNLKAANGEIILQSEGYTSQAAAWNGTIAVLEAIEAQNLEVKKAVNGEFYFVLTAQNGEVVGTSETYPTLDLAIESTVTVTGVIETILPQ
jgi:uncharacterized protein YegP (UPF0339 family)